MALRADAQDNLERIIDAAEELFTVSGLAVPMSEIARRANVGAATLSRRFPSKDALIDAVFRRQLSWWIDAFQTAERADDAWLALTNLLEEACVQQAHSRACAELVVRAFMRGNSFDHEKSVVRGTVEAIIARAQAQGAASDDVKWDDVLLLLEANAGSASLSKSVPEAEASARRLVHHFLRSFAAA